MDLLKSVHVCVYVCVCIFVLQAMADIKKRQLPPPLQPAHWLLAVPKG